MSYDGGEEVAEMDTIAALEVMLERSGMSKYRLSKELGKHPTYIGSTISKGSEIGAANLARMARIMGFRLVLVGEGPEIEIGGPEDADTDKGAADKRGGDSAPQGRG